ncbi:MFS transporter [Jiangella mangrovi]|uniref:DHA2 family multidrug resistance protein-like MFS transporter n=1 Tax=Jiangella mangrovi TaxID=1524084 RepID=A0A7W9LJ82_9ACTN|nr:MFS transporter [Jiangella mangrovi]MBB5785788.1 DHA2 family multidrug resistance protein-like MFS transporter [Jiangella mangrovi]
MTTTPVRAGRREWLGLAVLALPALLASMDLSVLSMAAPWLSADLEPSGSQLLWIMDVYGFLMAGLLITMGSLGDRIGRRRLLLAGAVAFGAASVLAAYATTPELLIAARALLVVGPVLLPESRGDGGPVDWWSAVLSLGAVLPVIYGVKEIATHGSVSASAVLAVAAGLVVGVLFGRRQLRLADPMIDVRLFRRPDFAAAIGSNAVLTFATGGMGALAVQYVQGVLGLRPFAAALWMLPTVAGTILGIAVANVLVRRVPAGVVVGAGMGVAALGFALVAQTVTPSSPVGVVIAAYTVLVLGVGMAISLLIDLVVGSAPPSRAGSVSAMSETAGEFGAALGIAVLGSIATAVYASELRSIGGVPESATGSLGAALAAGESVAAARAAFTHGFTVTATAGAGLLAAVAVVAGVILTRRRLR